MDLGARDDCGHAEGKTSDGGQNSDVYNGYGMRVCGGLGEGDNGESEQIDCEQDMERVYRGLRCHFKPSRVPKGDGLDARNSGEHENYEYLPQSNLEQV